MSEREAEVLAALAEHLSNAQIASRLHVSVRTVETHVSSLLRKLGVADRRALAALAPSVASGPSADEGGGARGVPMSWTPFIGRRRELDEVVAALGSSRLVTLLGPGGVGKTRLAAEVTRQLAPTLPLGATFVELVSTRPGFFIETVAAALGVMERPGQTLAGRGHRPDCGPAAHCSSSTTASTSIEDTADFLTALLGETGDLTRAHDEPQPGSGFPANGWLPLFGLSLVAPSTGGPIDSEAVDAVLRPGPHARRAVRGRPGRGR